MGVGTVFSFVLQCYLMFYLVSHVFCVLFAFAIAFWCSLLWRCLCFTLTLLSSSSHMLAHLVLASLGPLSIRCLGSSDAVLVIGRR